MAKHRTSGDEPSTRDEASDDPAYWSVDDSRWPAVRPDLPTHMVDLLAPPIVVGVARVPATSKLTPPDATAPDQAPVAVAPRRPVAPVPAGRHRRALER
ncbi:hypothetical protein ACTMS0_19780 [Micromonospora sp. H33]|uniref:hypothetical protein n=1 Tax=Micromonospora sp. H33 TaxID=3452215 RepID=UPI003F888AE1